MNKRKYILAALEWTTEIVILCVLHTLLGFETIGVYRYVLMFIVLSAALEGDHFSTVLIWQESKKIIVCNIVFFFVAIVMQPLKTLTFEIVFQNAMLCFLLAIFTITTERTYRVVFYHYFAQNVLIIGTGEQAKQLVQTCQRNRFSLQHVIGVVSLNNSKTLKSIRGGYLQAEQEFTVPVFEFDDIGDVIKNSGINQVIIAIPDAPRDLVNLIYDVIYGLVPSIKSVPQTNSMVCYDSRIEDFDGNILISSATERSQVVDRFLKRLLDIIAGIIGSILLIPLSVFVKVQFLRENDKGSIFFVQNRIGKDGKTIRIYKYRSMVENAESILMELMRNDDIAQEYQKNKKLKDDPRITKIGKLLRKTSLDEFPQFINVLKGDMSLVGPRPYLAREIPDMGQFYNGIVKVKPGITGMWQVSGRSDLLFKERCRLDDYYVRNQSIWLDFTIIIKTIRALLSREGAI